jgi:hypothetical protein
MQKHRPAPDAKLSLLGEASDIELLLYNGLIRPRVTGLVPRARLVVIDELARMMQRPVVRALQAFLDDSVGIRFETFEENQAFATEVQNLLNRLGLAAQCPKEGCGRPAKIRCLNSGPTTGSFQFDHVIDGKRTTHLGSTRFPQVKVIPAPADRRLKKNKPTNPPS